jgi:dihydroorotase
MYLLKNALLVTDGRQTRADLLLRGQRIERIDPQIEVRARATEIDCTNRLVLPGFIDDQVHFREPGAPHKATIGSEARAAVAGGVTSFMEMPNTNPATTNAAALDDKLRRAARTSVANYAFYLGATNDNLPDVLRADPRRIAGIKVFMGSSTGNMLVDDAATLDRLFAEAPTLIATHCEDEATIRANYAAAIQQYGAADNIPPEAHPVIRSVEACQRSSALAIELARRHNTRLHILHLTTEEELPQFASGPIAGKRITAEVCVHHLWFTADDYARLGHLIKCNPAIKAPRHRAALREALLDDRLDVIATDHAPHTWSEKHQPYPQAPSGLPLIQNTLQMMLTLDLLPVERIVEKMCHNPATLFGVQERGFLREGYFADVVIVDPAARPVVRREDVLYHVGWSPLEGETLRGQVTHTFVSGHLAWAGGQVNDAQMGEAVAFGGR